MSSSVPPPRATLRDIFAAEHARLKLERLYLTDAASVANAPEFDSAEPKRTREDDAADEAQNKKRTNIVGFKDLQAAPPPSSQQSPAVTNPYAVPSLLSSITAVFNMGVGPSRSSGGSTSTKLKTGGSGRLGERQFVSTATISKEDHQRVALFMAQQEKRIKARLDLHERTDRESSKFNLPVWLELLTSPDIVTFAALKRMMDKHRDALPTLLEILSQLHKRSMLPFIYSTLSQQIVDGTVAFPLEDVRSMQANPGSSFSFADYSAINKLDRDYMKTTLLANQRFDIDAYHPWDDESPNSVKFMKSELGNTIYNEAMKRDRIEESLLYASSVSFRQLFARDFFQQLLKFGPTALPSLTPGYTDRLFIKLFDDALPTDRAFVQDKLEDENNLLFGHYIPYKGLRIIAWNPTSLKYENYIIEEVPGFDDKLAAILARHKRSAELNAPKTSGSGAYDWFTNLLAKVAGNTELMNEAPALAPISSTTSRQQPASPPLSYDATREADSAARNQFLRDLSIEPEEASRYKVGDTAAQLNETFYATMATLRERWNQSGVPLTTRVADAVSGAGKYAVYGLGLQVFASMFSDWTSIKGEIQKALLETTLFKCRRYTITESGGMDFSSEQYEARALSETPISVPGYAPRQWVIQNREVKENRMMVTRPGFVNEEAIEVIDLERLTFVLSTSDNTNIRKGLIVSILVVTGEESAFFAPFAIIGGDYKTHIRLTYAGRFTWYSGDRIKIRPVLYNYGPERGWSGHRMFRMIRFGVYFETHSKQPCHTLVSSGYTGYVFKDNDTSTTPTTTATQTTTIVEMKD